MAYSSKCFEPTFTKNDAVKSKSLSEDDAGFATLGVIVHATGRKHPSVSYTTKRVKNHSASRPVYPGKVVRRLNRPYQIKL